MPFLDRVLELEPAEVNW